MTSKQVASKNKPAADFFGVLDNKDIRKILRQSCKDQLEMIKQAKEIEKTEKAGDKPSKNKRAAKSA
ncbi:hypothetical protein F4X86_03170 [Candidatus Saccharibacteria bacterium]|nr:hypothetical protein [Candidatus Saccharibacteria bacterium]